MLKCPNDWEPGLKVFHVRMIPSICGDACRLTTFRAPPPVSATSWIGVTGSLLVMLRLALDETPSVGAKVTVTWRAPAGGIVTGPENTTLNGAETVMPETVRSAVPWLYKERGSCRLLPTATVPKSRACADSARTGVTGPSPVREATGRPSSSYSQAFEVPFGRLAVRRCPTAS